MMAGALANNIQEVIRVQDKFGAVEKGVENNQTGIRQLNKNLRFQNFGNRARSNQKKEVVRHNLIFDVIGSNKKTH